MGSKYTKCINIIEPIKYNRMIKNSEIFHKCFINPSLYNAKRGILEKTVQITKNSEIFHQYFGNPSLHYAAQYSRTLYSEKIVQILVDNGADLNEQDNYGKTALMLAAENSNHTSTEETVKILINVKNPKTGFPLADLNIQDKKGNTALMLAAKNSNHTSTGETVKILINANNPKTGFLLADLNIQNEKGYTALMLAAKNSIGCVSADTIRTLINAKNPKTGFPIVDPNVQNKYGQTALMLASDYDHCIYDCHDDCLAKKGIEVLINTKNPETGSPIADLNLQDINGNTALMSAVRYALDYNSTWKVGALINAENQKTRKHIVDLYIENKKGETALSIAGNDRRSDISVKVHWMLLFAGIRK